MMRTSILSIFILLILCGTARAQDVETPVEYGTSAHTIGLNATGLILNLVNSETEDNLNPYLFLYNWDTGTINLRAGLGPQFKNSTETHEGFTDSQTDAFTSIDGRLGIGWDVLNQSRWKVMAGVDVVGGYLNDKSTLDTGFDKVTDKEESWNIGGGPFVQLVFFVAPRISLATETGLYFRRFETTATEQFENFPEFDNQLSKTTGSELDFILPTSLFIQFHF